MTRLWEVPDQYLDPEAFYAAFRDMAQEARDSRCDERDYEDSDASPVVIPARIRAIMEGVRERIGKLEAGYRMRGGK